MRGNSEQFKDSIRTVHTDRPQSEADTLRRFRRARAMIEDGYRVKETLKRVGISNATYQRLKNR